MQWLMLQQDKAEDFVIATGVQYSVRDFVNAAAEELGMKIEWRGEGVEEKGYWINSSLRGGEADAAIQNANKELDRHGLRPRDDSALVIAVDPPLLPSHRSRNPTGRREQGQTKTWLDTKNHLQGTGWRNGA